MSDIENASSYDPQLSPSYKEVYGDVLNQNPVLLDTEDSMLPEGFRDIQVWRDFMDSVDEVLGDGVGRLIRDFLGLNDVGYVTRCPNIDKLTLLKQAKYLGVTSDLNTFGSEDVKRFIRHSPEFWKEKGGRNFIQYASFVINATLKMDYTWTQNYNLFYREGSENIGAPVYEGGAWYPTSHVFLAYDIEKFRSSVNENYSSQEALSKFFYSIAPINLVIKSFLLSQTVNWNVFLGGSIQTRVWDSQAATPAYGTNGTRLAIDEKDSTYPNRLVFGGRTLSSKVLAPATSMVRARGNKSETSRKVYCEFYINAKQSGQASPIVGLGTSAAISAALGSTAASWVVRSSDGQKGSNGSFSAHYGSAIAAGDTVMLAWDPSTGRVWFGRNGTWTGGGNPATGASPTFTSVAGTLFPVMEVSSSDSLVTLADPDRYKYSTPSGYVKFGA